MASFQFDPANFPIMQLVMPDGAIRSIGRVANLSVQSEVIEAPLVDQYRRFLVVGRHVEAELRVRLYADCVSTEPKKRRRKRRKR